MRRIWKRVRKFISKPKYEYIYDSRSTDREERITDIPMIELMSSDRINEDCSSADVQLLNA